MDSTLVQAGLVVLMTLWSKDRLDITHQQYVELTLDITCMWNLEPPQLTPSLSLTPTEVEALQQPKLLIFL